MTTTFMRIAAAVCLLMFATPVLAAKAKGKGKKGKATTTQTAPAPAVEPAAVPTPPPPAVTPAVVAPAAGTPAAASESAPATSPAPIAPTPAAASSTPATSQAPVTEVRATKASAEASVVPSSETSAAAVQAAAAEPELGLTAGLKVGGTVPTSALGISYFIGMAADYRLPVLDRLLGVGLSLAFARPGKSGTLSGSYADQAVDYELHERLIVVALDVDAEKHFGDVSAFGGIGLGMYWLESSVELAGMTNRESQKRLGTQLFGGAAYRLGPGDLTAELRYHYVGMSFLATGDANAGGVTAAVGYRVRM